MNATKTNTAKRAEVLLNLFTPVAEDEYSFIALARRLGGVMDSSPALLFSELETRGFETSFDDIFRDLPTSALARRLQIAFAMAVDARMPAATRLLVLADWGVTVLKRSPAGADRAALALAVELATSLASSPSPERTAKATEALAELDRSCVVGTSVAQAAVCVQTAAEQFIANHSEPERPLSAWFASADILGIVERVGGEEAIAECAQLFAVRVYGWAERS